MKRYTKWVTASVALPTVGLLAGCGTRTNGPSANSGTNVTTHTMSTTNTAGVTPSTHTTPGAMSTIAGSNPAGSNQGQIGTQQVYVFSQPMLEDVYAVEYFRSVGPIFPPQSVEKEVEKWSPKVGMNMLQFVPASQQGLDESLI